MVVNGFEPPRERWRAEPVDLWRSSWLSRLPDADLRSVARENWVPARPLRELELITGERLYVEVLNANRETVEFRWRHANRCRVPWAIVAKIANPPGVVDVLDESFESVAGASARFSHSGTQSWPANRATSWRHAFSAPLATGQVQWCERFDLDSSPRGRTEVHLSFTAPGREDELIIVSRDDGVMTVEVPDGWITDFRQPLRAPTAWHSVSCDWNDSHWRVLLDNIVLASGRASDRALARVQLGPATEIASAWFDDLRVQCRHTKQELTRESGSGVALSTGDVLYGDITAIDHSMMRLIGSRGAVTIPWTEWAAIDRRAPDVPASTWIRGSIVHVEMSAPVWPPGLPRESWLAASIRDGAECEHPLLGRLVVSPGDTGSTSRQSSSELCWLHPGRAHVGDENRPEFHEPEPIGTAISGTFTLEHVPVGRCFVTLDVAELEPSGPETPGTQPFLQQLRGGALRTELQINGQLVGDLNRLVAWRPPASHPERLRMEVPRVLLTPGENRWEIRQQPLAPNDARFDDCEIGRIRLEIAP